MSTQVEVSNGELTRHEAEQVRQIAGWKSQPPNPLDEMTKMVTLPWARFLPACCDLMTSRPREYATLIQRPLTLMQCPIRAYVTDVQRTGSRGRSGWRERSRRGTGHGCGADLADRSTDIAGVGRRSDGDWIDDRVSGRGKFFEGVIRVLPEPGSRCEFGSAASPGGRADTGPCAGWSLCGSPRRATVFVAG